jgi:hypothetical protein
MSMTFSVLNVHDVNDLDGLSAALNTAVTLIREARRNGP